MSRFRTQQDYFQGARATNASFVGDWFWIEDADSIGFIASLTGTGSPTAAYSMDLSNDPDANKKNDPLHGTANDNQLIQAPTDWPLTAAQKTAANPAGTTANINVLTLFAGEGNGTVNPGCPRAKWARIRYNFASGGSASLLQRVSLSLRGI